MKILVANLGSTSFKYRLFDMNSQLQLARGGVERIGDVESQCFVEIGESKTELVLPVPDHGSAVQRCLEQLTDPESGCLKDASEVTAIGFKAVHGGRVGGVQRIDDSVLDAMEEMNQIAPAHNPPYIAAMRNLSKMLPDIPLIAAFETGFHETIREPVKVYGVPHEWSEKYQIRKWGFHGASHRYIAGRVAELVGSNDKRIISFHLGGSSSLCGIKDGKSVATSMGMSPQTGLPHNNRVGDFDPFALPYLMKKLGKSLDEVLDELANKSGLLGLSELSGDCRDLEEAASNGNQKAQLAIDMFVAEIRRHMGGMMMELGGLDAMVFTGGIGENGKGIRKSVCENLSEFGIVLDESKNQAVSGESQLQATDSKVEIWVIPTNEELVVARQAKELLEG